MNNNDLNADCDVISLVDLIHLLMRHKKFIIWVFSLLLIISTAFIWIAPDQYSYGQVLEAGSYQKVDGTRSYIDNNYALISKIKTVFIPQLIQNTKSVLEQQAWANLQFSPVTNTSLVAISLVAAPRMSNILQNKMLPQLLSMIIMNETQQTAAVKNGIQKQITIQQARVAQSTQYVNDLAAKIQALGLIPFKSKPSTQLNETVVVQQSLAIQSDSALQMGLLSLLNEQQAALSIQIGQLQSLQQQLDNFNDAHYTGNVSMSSVPAGMSKWSLTILAVFGDLVLTCALVLMWQGCRILRSSLRGNSAV